MKKILIACGLLSVSAQALEVHEWGTFTVLAGSNGSQATWYSPVREIAKLPPFVHSIGLGGKSGASKIRMETPVIYFYPEKPMQVSVEATFTNGMITEVFPYSPSVLTSLNPMLGKMSNKATWTGFLHPPADNNAMSRIPRIPAAKNEEPYGAAREVPDAWIFESDLKKIPGLDVQPPLPEMEKFIFYRGAGDAYLPLHTFMNGSDVTLTNQALGPLPFGTALRVRGGKASWIAIQRVATYLTDGKPSNNTAQVTLPPVDRWLDEVESELAAAWKSALAADGLTSAEASAMVETWRKTWFREEGDRVLTLMPRATIDQMLPLKISPQPAKTERVFVARIEMISPEKEQAIVRLLNSDKKPETKDLEEFNSLGLGRFVDGAIEIATQIQTGKMRQQYSDIALLKLPKPEGDISKN
jgi:hypothetical protein